MEDGNLTELKIKNTVPQAPAAEGIATGEMPFESLGISSMSLNALENGFSRDLLYFDGLLNNQKVRILVDGGSMGDFVSSDLVKRMQTITHIVPSQVLSFANGEQSICNKEVQDIELTIGNYDEQV